MARYVYEGPGPHEDDDGGLVRPGDVREFDQEPSWGPWRLEDGEALSASEPPASTGGDSPPPDNPPPGGDGEHGDAGEGN